MTMFLVVNVSRMFFSTIHNIDAFLEVSIAGDLRGMYMHNGVIKWKIFRVTGPLWGKPPVTDGFPSQRPATLMFYLICAWTNGLANNWDAGDLRHHRAHYDVTVMIYLHGTSLKSIMLSTLKLWDSNLRHHCVRICPNTFIRTVSDYQQAQ